MTATSIARRSFILLLSFAFIAGCFDWAVAPDLVLGPLAPDETPTGADATDAAEAPADIDGGVVDSGVVDSGVVDSGDPDACLSACDCDGDGFYDLSREGCADAGGLNDCDDHDKRTHPGQDFRKDLGTSPRNGDWNCTNGVERLIPPNVSCGLLALGACAGVGGFKGNPACGEEAVYTTCIVQLGLLCVEGQTSTRQQECK